MPRVGIKGYERIGFEKNRASKVKLMCGARGEFPSGSWNGAMKLTPGEEVHRRKESKRRMRHGFKIIPPSFQRDTSVTMVKFLYDFRIEQIYFSFKTLSISSLL